MRASTDLLALAAALVDIPSESRSEHDIVAYIEEHLRAVPWLSLDRVGENLVARTGLGRPWRVLLGGHTDTVPANANSSARIDGDTLWGLGSADMKGGLAALLELATTVDEPSVDVTYVFYAREEIAFEHNGLLEIEAERPDLLAADVALLGEPTDGVIEAGCQGTMRVRATFRGERAHTARPWMGDNAIHRLAAALARLSAYEERRPVIDGCTFREALQAVFVEGGVAGNVVPDEAVLTMNHRFAPDRTSEQAERHVRDVFDGLVDGDDLEVVDTAPGAAPGLGHPLLGALIERNSLEVRAKLGWTDVSFFAARGIPAANFGPGDSTLAHTHGERLERRKLEALCEALRDLLVKGAASP